MALRFPDQLLRDAREVLRAVRTRVRTLETDIKKSGEGMGGRSAVVIFIDHDVLDDISCAGEASDQRLQASAVVDYGEHRAGVVLGGEGGDASGDVLYGRNPDLRAPIHATAMWVGLVLLHKRVCLVHTRC